MWGADGHGLAYSEPQVLCYTLKLRERGWLSYRVTTLNYS